MGDDALADLGWSEFFRSQLQPAEAVSCRPVRVIAVHRGHIDIAGGDGEARLNRTGKLRDEPVTVGDWLLVERDGNRPRRVLERKSLFKRRAAGSGRDLQLIAANVDTLFIVTSCNQDFNPARLERYLALAAEASVTPVFVLTKADQCEDPQGYRDRVKAMRPAVAAELVNALDAASLATLSARCGPGQTVALVGSSGVGKSTIVNTLTGDAGLRTGGVRESDDRGRHTTSGRALFRLAAGGLLVDTPGMRELQLVDVRDGIEAAFDDIVELAAKCRFTDCRHKAEPNCAVRAAIEAGELDQSRLQRYRKLAAEDRANSRALASCRDR